MRHSTLFILLGLIALTGGGLALLNPLAASLAMTTLVGIFFLIGGAGQLWLAFSQPDQPNRVADVLKTRLYGGIKYFP